MQAMLTPPRMPMNIQPPKPSFVPQVNGAKPPNMPNCNTPALNVRVPTFTPNINQNTQTIAQAQVIAQTQALIQSRILNFLTLQFNQLGQLVRVPNFVVPPNGNGIGGPGFNFIPQIPTVNIVQGLNRIPTLGIGIVRRNTLTVNRIPLTSTRVTGNVMTGSRQVRIPSLSFNQRPPLSLPTRPPIGGTNPATAQRPGVGGRTPAQVVQAPRTPVTPVNSKPGIGTPSVQMTGRLNFNCGSCHTCKQNKTTGLVGVGTQPFLPATTVRPPVLPAQLPPPVLAQRPVQTLVVGKSPLIRQPVRAARVANGQPTAAGAVAAAAHDWHPHLLDARRQP